MGSFGLSPESALAFVVAALCWLVLVGFVGWHLVINYLPWNWPGGINWRRLLLGSLVQGFLGMQLVWLWIPAQWLNVFFQTGPPLPAAHSVVQGCFQ